MRFSDFLLVSNPTDLDFIVGYTDDQNIRINVLDLFAGQIIGSGTAGYIPLFTAANVIDDSVLYQDGSNIVIGGEDSLGYRLAIAGSLLALDGAVIESSTPGSDTFRTVGEEGDSFIIPNDSDESVWTSRRIMHAAAVLSSESATLGQVNTAISDLEGDIEILLDLKVDKSSVGEPNGVASLDATGKIPLSEIPDSIIGQVEYMGTWNAFTNTPTLNPLVPEQKGHYYVVSAAGVFGGVDYAVGDWIISNGVEWQKVDNTDAVTSVFGRIGAILPLEADYQSFYPRLSQAYDNPTWINSLAFTKITDVPPFLLENQTITLSGDVTGSGKTSISTTISNNSVSNEKLRDSVGTSVIGRSASSTGDPADIQAGTDGHVLLRSAGNLLFGLISSDSISSIDWSKITGTPTTLSGYGITDAYTKTESDNKFVPYTGANANVNLGSNNITANSFIKAGGTSSQFLKADGSVDTNNYVPTTRSVNAGTGLTGGGNLSSDITIAFDTTWGDTRYAYRTRQLTINGTTYDLSADRTWNVGTVTSIATTAPITGGTITGTGTIGITQAGSASNGFLSSTDWNTFNNKQATISLTTTGNSGSSTFISNVLNVPTYTLAGLGGVPTTRTITINGLGQDLSVDRTWSVGTVTSVAALTLGTTGTDLSSTVANGTTTPVITLNVPTASATNRGALSAADWTTFNSKQNALTNPVTGTGTTNYLPKFTGASTIGNSVIQESSGNIGIGVTPTYKLDVSGSSGAYWNGSTYTGGTPLAISITNTEVGGYDPVLIFQQTDSGGTSKNAGGIGIVGRSSWTSGNNSTQISDMYFLVRNDNGGISERMRLTSSGNLGLGVTPSAWNSAFGSVLQFKSAGSNGGGALTGSGGSNFRMFANTFYDGSYKYIVNGRATQYEQDGYHAWYTSASGTAGNAITFTQAMTLTAGGNLLVGTTTDNGARLQVNGSSTITSRLLVGTSTGVGQDFVSFRFNSGDTFSQGLNMVDSNASASSSTFQVFRKSDDTYLGNIRRSGTDNAIFIGGNSYLALGANNTENVRITSSGNVGIGTTNPLNKLSVVSSNVTGYYNRTEAIAVFHGALPTVLIANDGNATDQYAELKLGNNQSTYYTYSAYIRGIQGAGIDRYRLEFGTSEGSAATTKVTISQSGNVGIGTNSPGTYDAALIGTSHRFFNIQSTSNTYAVATLAGNQSSADSRIGYLTFVNDNNSSGYKYSAWIGSEVEGATANQQGGRLIFSTTGNASSAGPIERMRITSGGNIGIGTDSPASLLTVSSGSNTTIRLNNTDGSIVLDQVVGNLEFYSNDADGPHITGFIKSIGGETFGRRNHLVFGTSITNNQDAVEVMRITSAGNTELYGNLSLRAAATGSTATHVPVFTADPAATTRSLLTRTLQNFKFDVGSFIAKGVRSNAGDYTRTLDNVNDYSLWQDNFDWVASSYNQSKVIIEAQTTGRIESTNTADKTLTIGWGISTDIDFNGETYVGCNVPLGTGVVDYNVVINGTITITSNSELKMLIRVELANGNIVVQNTYRMGNVVAAAAMLNADKKIAFTGKMNVTGTHTWSQRQTYLRLN